MMDFIILLMGLLSILVWVDYHSEIPDFNVPSWTDQFIDILMQNVGKLMWHSVFKHSWPKTIRRDSFRGELHDFRLWRKIKKSSSVDFQGYFEQKILVFWLYIIRMVFLLFLFPDQLKDPSFGRKVYISNHFHRGQAAPTLFLITINTANTSGSFTVAHFSVHKLFVDEGWSIDIITRKLLIFFPIQLFTLNLNYDQQRNWSVWFINILFGKYIAFSFHPCSTLFDPGYFSDVLYIVSSRPHPSSILLGKGFSSDSIGDGPPPPSSPRHFNGDIYLDSIESGPPPQQTWDPLKLYLTTRLPPKFAISLLLDFCQTIHQHMCGHLAVDQFLGGPLYLSSILIYSHQQDLLLLVLSLLNGEEVPIADLYIIASTPMDSIITSWRNARKSQSTLGQHWNQYFSRLDSMGPFAGESWITVHASLSWLMDSSILYQNAPILPSSDHWRLMIRFRRMLNKGIIQHVRSCTPVKHSLSTPPPPPPPPIASPIPAPKVSLPGIVPKLSASVPLQTAPKKDASRVPRRKRGRKLIPPLYISVFIGRRRKKRKRRRHQRREFYHRYYRPTRSPPIPHVPLADTAVPDKHVNRSFGSSNSLDPPDK